MSSTNRGAIRSDFDYYITDPDDATLFLRHWRKTNPEADRLLDTPSTRVFDPCAGGNKERVLWLFKEGVVCPNCGFIENEKDCQKHKPKFPVIFDIPPTPCSYPTALRRVCDPGIIIDTNDIRIDSPAEQHANFLLLYPANKPDIIITNPPFDIALQVIEHSLKIVKPGGLVVMLLRLNFFGSGKRKSFFDRCMPISHDIHHERLGFTPDGKTDSIEYMHATWKQGVNLGYSAGRVI